MCVCVRACLRIVCLRARAYGSVCLYEIYDCVSMDQYVCMSMDLCICVYMDLRG